MRIQGSKFLEHWRSGFAGATITVLIGICLWRTPIGKPLENLSYDLLFIFRHPVNIEQSGVIIIEIDEKSYAEFGQKADKPWDRSIHARLLDRLTADGAKLVALDVFLADPGPSYEADKQLAQALTNNGRVVLAVGLTSRASPFIGDEPAFPQAAFLDSSAAWGLVGVYSDYKGGFVRQMDCGEELNPSFSWAAAALVNTYLPKEEERLQEDRWMNYYGKPGTLPTISYLEALNQPHGYFRDKFVFIGHGLIVGLAYQQRDTFLTPFSRLFGRPSTGVEIHATAFLNLVRNDWLMRLSLKKEFATLLIAGVLFGFGLSKVRPLVASGLALLGIFGLLLFAVLLFRQNNIWIPWLIIAGAQIPCAFIWAIVSNTQRLYREKEVLQDALRNKMEVSSNQKESSGPGTHNLLQTKTIEATNPQETMPPPIPDHTLLQCIGKGGYGVVWLARDAIGTHHAVKIISRKTFPSDTAFEREFKGIQKFTPMSRSDPGFVHILHVGRNDAEGYFFYIMELADDMVLGQRIDPTTYVPRNLASEIAKWKRIPADHCVKYALILTSALDYLHRQGLIHRDIKPSNIIFVNGMPKLADIGLVTHMATPGHDVTYVGTEGYIPPEGPGTASADIYSLGKVIYEASMGLDRKQYPELPSTLIEHGSPSDLLIQLNEIILKACEEDSCNRYHSAAEMHADLLKIQNSMNF